MDGLENVHYSYRTPYGTVLSDLTQTSEGSTLKVTVPVGSRATLYLPTNQRGNISESNRPLREAKGVTMQGGADGCTILQLEQGSYTFQY